MTIPTALEQYTILSLEKALRAGLSGVNVLEPGLNDAATTTDNEWIEVHALNVTQENTRATNWAGAYLFQVNCVSRTANKRSDGSRIAPWTLAGRVRALLQPTTGKGIMISPLGGSGDDVSFMVFPRIEQQYIQDFQAGGGAGGGVPANPSNLHAVALTVTGVTVV